MVDNIVGASGNIAGERLTKSAPDGYTIGLLNTAQTSINPGLYKLSFDATRDLAPMSLVGAAPWLRRPIC
jgi:tripartite-type tricarboxylate transporter receptor subunit TctC